MFDGFIIVQSLKIKFYCVMYILVLPSIEGNVNHPMFVVRIFCPLYIGCIDSEESRGED